MMMMLWIYCLLLMLLHLSASQRISKVIGPNDAACYHDDGEPHSDCYAVPRGVGVWARGAAACARLGGSLAIVPGLSTRDVVSQALRGEGQRNTWLGGRKAAAAWHWAGGQRAGGSQWANWEVAHPSASDTSRDCTGLVPRANYTWRDEVCARRGGYVCETDAVSDLCVSGSLFSEVLVSGSRCFLFEDAKFRPALTWHQAQYACAQHKARLAHIDNEAAHARIRQGAPGRAFDVDFYWIGLTRAEWKWNTGVTVSGRLWGDGQPSVDGNCVTADVNGRLVCADCNTQLRYTCKLDMSTFMTTKAAPPTLSVTTVAVGNRATVVGAADVPIVPQENESRTSKPTPPTTTTPVTTTTLPTTTRPTATPKKTRPTTKTTTLPTTTRTTTTTSTIRPTTPKTITRSITHPTISTTMSTTTTTTVQQRSITQPTTTTTTIRPITTKQTTTTPTTTRPTTTTLPTTTKLPPTTTDQSEKSKTNNGHKTTAGQSTKQTTPPGESSMKQSVSTPSHDKYNTSDVITKLREIHPTTFPPHPDADKLVCIPLDLTFILHASSGLNPDDWNKMIQFLAAISKVLVVNDTCARLAVVTSSEGGGVEVNLRDSQKASQQELTSRILATPFSNARRSNIHAAFSLAASEIFKTENGDREHVKNAAIVIGSFHDIDPNKKSNPLNVKVVKTIALVVANSNDTVQDWVNHIVSEPFSKHVVSVDTYAELEANKTTLIPYLLSLLTSDSLKPTADSVTSEVVTSFNGTRFVEGPETVSNKGLMAILLPIIVSTLVVSLAIVIAFVVCHNNRREPEDLLRLRAHNGRVQDVDGSSGLTEEELIIAWGTLNKNKSKTLKTKGRKKRRKNKKGSDDNMENAPNNMFFNSWSIPSGNVR